MTEHRRQQFKKLVDSLSTPQLGFLLKHEYLWLSMYRDMGASHTSPLVKDADECILIILDELKRRNPL